MKWFMGGTILGCAFGLVTALCLNLGSERAVSDTQNLKTSIDVWEASGAPPAEKVNARHEWCLAFHDGLMVVTEYEENRKRLEMAFLDCIDPTR